MECLEVAAPRFGDHLARQVFVELVDHHPIDAEIMAQLACGLLDKILDPVESVETRRDRAQRGELAVELAIAMGFDFENDVVAGTVQRAVEFRFAVRQFQPEHAFDLIGQADCSSQTADALAGSVAQQRAQLHPLLDLLGKAEHILQVFREMRHEPVGVEGDQRAKRLDMPQLVNRLAIAIGQVDGLVHRSHAASLP